MAEHLIFTLPKSVQGHSHIVEWYVTKYRSWFSQNCQGYVGVNRIMKGKLEFVFELDSDAVIYKLTGPTFSA